MFYIKCVPLINGQKHFQQNEWVEFFCTILWAQSLARKKNISFVFPYVFWHFLSAVSLYIILFSLCEKWSKLKFQHWKYLDFPFALNLQFEYGNLRFQSCLFQGCPASRCGKKVKMCVCMFLYMFYHFEWVTFKIFLFHCRKLMI